jgi:hypothetical protein
MNRKTPEQRLRRQLAFLFEAQHGLCAWCQRPMILLDGTAPRHKPYPKNGATIDHLEDRFSPDRGKFHGTNTYRHVAACSECNGRRGAESQRAVGKEELYKRGCCRPDPSTPPILRIIELVLEQFCPKSVVEKVAA